MISYKLKLNDEENNVNNKVYSIIRVLMDKS